MLGKIIAFFAIILGAVLMNLLFVFIFVNATVVNCALEANESYSCHIQTLLLGKIPTWEKDLEQVVDIKTESDSCDDGCSYRAEFVTSNGNQYPLSDVYTDRGPVQAQVTEIRALIQQRVDPLIYRADPPWWVLWLISGLTIMTIFLAPLVFLRNR